MNARCPSCGFAFESQVAPGLKEACPRCLAAFALAEPEDAPLKPGASFHGLEILQPIGHGGMGVVYKARQTDLDRLVALKVLSPRLAADPEFIVRFNREAKALAALNHPNIVHVHDVGKDADLLYLVMEFVDGVSLRELMRDGRLSPAQALKIVPQICDALEFAHSHGVLHRDIKPENILIDRDGRVKIADFGLAKMLRHDDAVATQTNISMGTPAYMAPEQHECLKTVDHRADIYSLGVVFYEMLTGELPVGRFDPPSQRVHIDVRLDDVVMKALEKHLDKRYQRAAHVKTDLETVVATPVPKPPNRAAKMATACAVLAVGCTLTSLVFIAWPATVPTPWLLAVPKAFWIAACALAARSLVALRHSPVAIKERRKIMITLTFSLLSIFWPLIALNVVGNARVAAAHPQENDLDDLFARLGADDPTERDAAQRALTLMGSAAREAVADATGSSDPEVALRAAQILQDITLGESLRKWGEGELAFWTVVWDLHHVDPHRLALVLEVAFPDAKDRERILTRRDHAAKVLKTFMNDWSMVSRSDEELARYSKIREEVKNADLPLVPPLVRILEYDMFKAFQFDPNKPEFQDVYDYEPDALAQVKALCAIGWLAPKGVLAVVGRHLDNPSHTAKSQAIGVIEILTGKKLTREEFQIWASSEQITEARRWWQDHRDEYLKPRTKK
ncbi:MAG: protein kinase [Planctomycetes bacterium]|nr:protein kinase [Planctomycetota bacterium]